MIRAFTRPPSRRLSHCELTYLTAEPIDFDLASVQHRDYENALRWAGADVIRLPRLDPYPDSVFVEDSAIVLDDLVLITRPAMSSRRGEAAEMAADLASYSSLNNMQRGRLDGGDVLRVGQCLYVGQSTRTDRGGLKELRRQLEPKDWKVKPVSVSACLHLKTAVTLIEAKGNGQSTLVLNPDWVDCSQLPDLPRVVADSREPFGANVLAIADRVIVPASSPRTSESLAKQGFNLLEVDIGEFEKAEAGLSCMSLIQHTNKDE